MACEHHWPHGDNFANEPIADLRRQYWDEPCPICSEAGQWEQRALKAEAALRSIGDCSECELCWRRHWEG